MKTVHWFLVCGRYWYSATARGSETAREAVARESRSMTHVICSKPDGFTPSEWIGALASNSELKPNLSHIVLDKP